jgi:N6-adenosine-specific RNA methylase IME4
MQYRTIVADPPWRYNRKWNNGANAAKSFAGRGGALPMPYSEMTLAQIAALPVASLADPEGAHLYLWTTNKYLGDAFGVVKAWGFTCGQVLVWAKTPGGNALGDAFTSTTEFILFCRRGKIRPLRRINSTWFNWNRTSIHSRKPEAFQDLVEQVSPGPYLELFARRKRLNWDSWGNEVESDIALGAD